MRKSNECADGRESGNPDQHPATVTPGIDEEPQPEVSASNAGVMLLAGGFIAAMIIVVAAEFVRHQFL